MDRASMAFHWDVRAGEMRKGEWWFGNGIGIQSGISGSYRIYSSNLTAISCSSEINLKIFQLRSVAGIPQASGVRRKRREKRRETFFCRLE